MIGVIAKPADHPVVREFFELFKTPWEHYRANRQYDVLLCATDGEFDIPAKLVVVYSAQKIDFDDRHEIRTGPRSTDTCILNFEGSQIPIYQGTISMLEAGKGKLWNEESRASVAYVDDSND